MDDLGVLSSKGGGAESRGLDLNNFGDVAGWSTAGRNKWRAIVDTASDGMIDLGTLGGNSSQAHGINGLGEAVGLSHDNTGAYVAFVHTATTGMFSLEPQVLGLDTSRLLDGKLLPWKINVAGEICGPGENEFNFYNIHGEAYVIKPAP